jgi:membrane peptidoglycan carboxypeptidase
MQSRSLRVTHILQNRQAKSKRHQVSTSVLGRKIFLAFSAVLAVGLTVLLVWSGVILGSVSRNLPDISQLPQMLNPTFGSLLTPTLILDRTAQVQIDQLGTGNFSQEFLSISLSAPHHFSQALLQTFVLAFQPDFWSSPGVRLDHLTDPIPSTIAERLVHDLLLWDETDGTSKSLRMRLLAFQVVAVYGREQTLEWFLNSLYFGHNILGVEEASQAFFKQSASQLDMAESAILVAIANSPALNPWDAPQQSKLLQEELLTRLFVEGKLAQSDYTQARAESLTFQKEPFLPSTIYSGFTQLLTSQLEGSFADHRLERGGLTIVSTLDVDLQEQSVCVLHTRLSQLEMKPSDFSLPSGKTCQANQWLVPTHSLTSSFPENLNGSVVILDPQTGQVLAMIADESLNSFGDSLQAHSPGSSLTPFIATAAFSRGFSPASLLWDIPSLNDGTNPQAIQETFQGPVRFRIALGEDLLRPVIQVRDQLGTDIVWKLAEPFGITDIAQSGTTGDLLYSGGSLSPLRLAQAYSVFANLGSMSGWRTEASRNLAAVSVINVLDSKGEPFWSPVTESQPVLSSQLAYLVHDVLSDNQGWQSDVWQQISPSINRPAGVKLGKTSDGKNAWAIGYTPQRVTVVWLGLPDSSSPVRLEAKDAGDIWQAVMIKANQNLPVLGWSIPIGISSVTVCNPSGLLPTRTCPFTVPEIFLNGNEPTQVDNLYQEVSINKETGRLATVYTSPTLVEQKLFMIVPAEARSWASAAGIAIPPTEYDQVPVTFTNPQVQIEQPAMFSVVSGKVEIRGTASSENFKSAWVEVGQGIDPSSWLKPGETFTSPVSDGLLATWDTQGLSGLYAVQLNVLHQDQTFDSTVIQVTVDNTPPVVVSIYPKSNDTLATPSANWIVLLASASDDIGLDRVEWWLDGVKVGVRYVQTFSLPVHITTGHHTLRIRAFDSAGNMSQTEPYQFDVK